MSNCFWKGVPCLLWSKFAVNARDDAPKQGRTGTGRGALEVDMAREGYQGGLKVSGVVRSSSGSITISLPIPVDIPQLRGRVSIFVILLLGQQDSHSKLTALVQVVVNHFVIKYSTVKYLMTS